MMGYGTKILELGLIEANKIGLKEVLVTCDDDNHASRRIIEKLGGVFIKSMNDDSSKTVLQYRIKTT